MALHVRSTVTPPQVFGEALQRLEPAARIDRHRRLTMQGGGESEARYMRRKVKAGLIEADHADCAIVVHYEVEATVLGDMGEPIVAERQDNVKRIKLKTLNENTNIARLAQEMVEKCKLIHPSKLPLVERLLEELQEHQVSCLTLTRTRTRTLTLTLTR